MSVILKDIFNRTPSLVLSSAIALILILLACIIHQDTALSMIDIWTKDVTFYHCFLVPFIFIWLVYRKKEILFRSVVHFEPLALPVIIAVGVFVVAFQKIGINLFAHAGFIFLLQLIIIICLGRHICKILLFPILFLSFMIPFGTELIMPLQNFTAFMSVGMLKLSGVSVHYEGIHITTDRARFFVAEACAGLRFLIANIFVMCLFAHLTFKTVRSWIFFLPFMIGIPIFGNCLRAYMIMMIGHYTDGVYASGVDHLVYGWGFFAVLAFINLVIGDKIADYENRRYDAKAIIINDSYKDYLSTPPKMIFHNKLFPATIFALLAGYGVSYHLDNMADKIQEKPAPQFLTLIPDPLKSLYIKTEWQTSHPDSVFFAQSDAVFHYYNGQKNLYMGSVYYKTQNANKEATRYQNGFHNEENWLLLGQKKIVLAKMPFIAELSGLTDGQKRLILYSYFVSEPKSYAVSNYHIKMGLLTSLLKNGNTSGGVFYIMRDIQTNMSFDDALETIQKDISIFKKENK